MVSTRSRVPSSRPKRDRGTHHGVVEGADGAGGEPGEGAVKGGMAGHGLPVEGGEPAQAQPVGDAGAQLPQIPVLDALQGEGAQGLHGAESRPARPGLLESAHQILVHQPDALGVGVQEGRDRRQERVEREGLGGELDIGKADLAGGAWAHGASFEGST